MCVCLCVSFSYFKALECFKSVLIVFEVFPECLKDVGCFISVLSVFEGCFKIVSGVFQDFSRVFQECLKNASRVL